MTTPDVAGEPIALAGSSSQDRHPGWYLKLSETWHTMSQVLGLKRLQDLIQGTSSSGNEPAWLLGLWYGLHNKDDDSVALPEEMLHLLLEDFSSKFWFTYRRGFEPIGSTGLTSDVGWGCTIRSGQMLMAEALSRCWWGRTTRLPGASAPQATAQQAPTDSNASVSQSAAGAAEPTVSQRSEQQLLLLFTEQPGCVAPFSIHNICKAGASHGVVAGQWLGPWVLCKALAAAAASSQHGQQQQPSQQLGLHVHVVCDPGGGAPTLELHRLKELFNSAEPQQQQQQPPEVATGSTSSSADGQQPVQRQGLLVLVPLTLGVGKVNELYLPQLSAMLTFPQSVGIVGGRPSASLYFLGVQGSSVIYLDPHEVQKVAVLPDDVSTFHCLTPRLMPLAGIDPSLAIGFYCRDTVDLDDLSDRLQRLVEVAGGAPLMTVVAQSPGEPAFVEQEWVGQVDDLEKRPATSATEDWELV